MGQGTIVECWRNTSVNSVDMTRAEKLDPKKRQVLPLVCLYWRSSRSYKNSGTSARSFSGLVSLPLVNRVVIYACSCGGMYMHVPENESPRLCQK